MLRVLWAISLAVYAEAQRHNFDKRCPAAATLDLAGQQRDPSSESSYLFTTLAAGSTVQDCVIACCGDWSCVSFAFYTPDAAARPADCKPSGPCCVFKDDLDALVKANASSGVVTGKRAHLAAKQPPYPASKLSATVHKELTVINGDEFPITWGADGAQYTGAGDNHQAVGNTAESPLSFFRVAGGPTELGCSNPPTHHNQPSPTCKNITEQGPAVAVKSAASIKACPGWHDGIPNIKSSAVLSVGGTLYWAISCFNYGDDDTFNRQRYGPAWIITSTDGGVTWKESATPTDFFTGRLAAPRFVQYGRDYAGARDGYVYIYFPGTTGGSAFFENSAPSQQTNPSRRICSPDPPRLALTPALTTPCAHRPRPMPLGRALRQQQTTRCCWAACPRRSCSTARRTSSTRGCSSTAVPRRRGRGTTASRRPSGRSR